MAILCSLPPPRPPHSCWPGPGGRREAFATETQRHNTKQNLIRPCKPLQLRIDITVVQKASTLPVQPNNTPRTESKSLKVEIPNMQGMP